MKNNHRTILRTLTLTRIRSAKYLSLPMFARVCRTLVYNQISSSVCPIHKFHPHNIAPQRRNSEAAAGNSTWNIIPTSPANMTRERWIKSQDPLVGGTAVYTEYGAERRSARMRMERREGMVPKANARLHSKRVASRPQYEGKRGILLLFFPPRGWWNIIPASSSRSSVTSSRFFFFASRQT